MKSAADFARLRDETCRRERYDLLSVFARFARAFGRSFVVGAAIALFFVACATDDPPDEPLPLCPDLGCDNAFCDSAGNCTCNVDGESVACRFEESL